MVILTHIEDPIKWVLRTGLCKQQTLQVSLFSMYSEWPRKRQVTTKTYKVANSAAVGFMSWLNVSCWYPVGYMDPPSMPCAGSKPVVSITGGLWKISKHPGTFLEPLLCGARSSTTKWRTRAKRMMRTTPIGSETKSLEISTFPGFLGEYPELHLLSGSPKRLAKNHL